MSTIDLDELTYARAKRLAEDRNVSVEQIITQAIERFSDIGMSTPQRSDIADESSERSLQQMLAPLIDAAAKLSFQLPNPHNDTRPTDWKTGVVDKFRKQGFDL